MSIFSCRPRRTCKPSRALRSRSSCSAGRSGSSRCSCNPRGPRRACQPIPSCRTLYSRPVLSSLWRRSGPSGPLHLFLLARLSHLASALLSLCSRRSRWPCIPRRTGRTRRSGWSLYTDSTPRPGSSGSTGRSGHSWHAAGAGRAFFPRRAHRPRWACSSGRPGHYYVLHRYDCNSIRKFVPRPAPVCIPSCHPCLSSRHIAPCSAPPFPGSLQAPITTPLLYPIPQSFSL